MAFNSFRLVVCKAGQTGKSGKNGVTGISGETIKKVGEVPVLEV